MKKELTFGQVIDQMMQSLHDANTPASILRWFSVAKPTPTNQNIIQQMAYHFEEVAEMCQAVHCDEMANQLIKLKTTLLSLDGSQCDNFNASINKVALLDALCDQIVTALGVGQMMGFDMLGALMEVNRSNWSKFDEQGLPIIDEQGKITKGNAYTPPNLTSFV